MLQIIPRSSYFPSLFPLLSILPHLHTIRQANGRTQPTNDASQRLHIWGTGNADGATCNPIWLASSNNFRRVYESHWMNAWYTPFPTANTACPPPPPPQALTAMSIETGGIVTCPRTKDSFKFSDVKKVYVM